MNHNSIENVIQRIQLPKEIQVTYESMGVTSLYQWQSECLFNTDVLNGKNLIYCAPTSGGKTLVAELILLRAVLLYKKKAIFVLPYVSLVIEKEKYIKKLLNRYNRNKPINERIKVRGFYGDHAGSRSFKEHILICTIEKANGIFNTLLMRNRGNQIGCLVFDEFHVLGNSFNGALIEILISKVKFMEYKSKLLLQQQQLQIQNIQQIPLIDSNQKAAAIKLLTESTSESQQHASAGAHIQVIALSATMGNVQDLSDWLQGDIYRTTFRPIPLIERIKAGNELLDPSGVLLAQIPSHPAIPKKGVIDHDPDHFILFCEQGLRRGQQVLIFCASKFACLQTCKSLVDAFVASTMTSISINSEYPPILSHKKVHTSNINELTDNMKLSIKDLLDSRKRLLETLLIEEPHLEAILQSSILHGIAYHHAGLSPNVRSQIEKGFRNGFISVLAATSTLAAGVNLPAGRVLIRSLQIGKDYLNVMQYRQMMGRAGRMGQGADVGESFLLVKSTEKSRALELSNKPMPNVTSQLDPKLDAGNALLKAILEGVGLGLCSTVDHSMQYIRQTLLYKQSQNNCFSGDSVQDGSDIMLSKVASILLFLINTRILDSNNNNLNKLLNGKHLESMKENSIGGNNMLDKNNVTIDDHALKSTLKITRFGKAIMQSNTDPDEAIVIYESLLRAQDGLHLEISLHLLYLITPLEHNIYPNFRKLLNFYESSHSSKQRLLANIFDAIGVDFPTLNRWQVNPPSRVMINICTDAVKLHGIYADQDHDKSTIDISQFKHMKKFEWQVLCRCKRIWAAIALQGIIDGKPIQIICKEFEVDVKDVDTLQRSTQIMTSKVIRFCEQIGWSSMERIFTDFKPFLQMNTEESQELKTLMLIPMMTSKIAKVLFQNNIVDTQTFVNIAPEVIAQILQLSIGFEMQEIENIEVQLEIEESRNSDLLNSKDSSTQCSTTSTIVHSATSRDEVTRLRLTSLISTLQTAARYMEEKCLAEIDSKACDVLAAIDKCSHNAMTVNDKALYSNSCSSMDLECDSENESIGNNDIDSVISGAEESGESDSEVDDQLENDDNQMQYCSPIDQMQILSHEQLNETFDCNIPITTGHYNINVNNNVPHIKDIPKINNDCTATFIIPETIDVRQIHLTNFDTGNSPALKIAKVSHDNDRYEKVIGNNIHDHSYKACSSTTNNNNSFEMFRSPLKVFTDRSLHKVVITPINHGNHMLLDNNFSSLHQWEGLSEKDLNALIEDLESSGILQVTSTTTTTTTTTMAEEDQTKIQSTIFDQNNENHYIYYPMAPPLEFRCSNSTSSRPIYNHEKILQSPHKAIASVVNSTECNSAYKISIYKVNSNTDVRDMYHNTSNYNVTEDIDFDEEILKAIEELERQGILPEAVGSNNNHLETHTILENNEGFREEILSAEDQQININENSRDSVVSCSELLKESFANSLTISNLQTIVKNMDSKSPYISPFTASKIRTPGKYLYYPIWQIDRLSATKDLSLGKKDNLPTNMDNFSRLADGVSSGEKQGMNPIQISPKESEVHHSPSIPQYPSELKLESNNLGFGVRQIRNDIHCIQFLNKLQSSRCVSFELVYRPLPTSWLSRYKSQDPLTIKSNKQHLVYTWTPYISWACSKQTSVTCSASDNYLENKLSTDCASKRNMFRIPHVLIGVALNFGDEFGYYLPLPTPLPLIPNPYHINDIPLPNYSCNATVTIENLPPTIREVIASYIGFGLILNKCFLLRKYCQQQKSMDSNVFESILKSNKNELNQVSNPLFLVSKKWCFSTRSALLMAWRKGACVEWKVFSDILLNPKMTKIAIHLKSKMVVLRERDLLLEGPIEDPSIAQSLLVNCLQNIDNISIKIPKLTTNSNHHYHHQQQQEHQEQHQVAGSNQMDYEALINGQKIACFRAVAVMRAMSEMEIKMRSCSMLDLYRNIEMPLLYCTSDAELTGFEINSVFFSRLRQALTDRQQMIQSYFQALYGTSFNLDSYVDVRNLKKKLIHEIQQGYISKANYGIQTSLNFMPSEDEITRAISHNHPLMQLISEYRSNTRTLPLCSSILGSRYFDRVRAVYNTLGTETGRVILVNPPLQQIPKLCTYLNAERISLHEELENCVDEARRQAVITYLNSKRSNSHSSSSIIIPDNTTDKEEWVRVVSLHQTNLLMESPHNSIPVYSTGKLVKVLDIPITSAPVLYGTTVEESTLQPTQSLLEIWCNAGFHYNIENALSIRQVIVEFSDTAKCYAYPADKVFRLNADIKPNTDEVNAIKAALQQPSEWVLPYLTIDSTVNFNNTKVNYSHNSIKVRDGFQSSEGYILLAADYSQIELRILSHYACDESLCSAFLQDIDVFKAIASSWLNKSIIDEKERNQVKQICYALIYGAGPSLVAEQANISVDVARNMMNDFLLRYPGIQSFLINTKTHAKKIGYVETLLGRRRYLPDLNNKDKKLQSKAERQAVNTLCQGSAADLIKLAMINIHCKLSELSRISSKPKKPHVVGSTSSSSITTLSSSIQFHRSRQHPGAGLYRLLDDIRPVLQVHDELIFEIKTLDLYKVAAIVKECMENAVQLNVPLHVKLSSGRTWGSMVPLELNEMDSHNPLCNNVENISNGSNKSITLYESVMNGSMKIKSNLTNSNNNITNRSNTITTTTATTTIESKQPLVIRDLFGRD